MNGEKSDTAKITITAAINDLLSLEKFWTNVVLNNKKLREELLALLKRSVIGFFLGCAIALLAEGVGLTETPLGLFDGGKYLSWRIILGVTILVAVYPYIWEILKGKG